MIESGSVDSARIDALLSPDTRMPVAEVSWYRQPYVAATRLLAQVKYAPRSTKADDLVEDLMKLRGPRFGWGSTYSNAWPLIALATYGEFVAETMSGNEIALRLGADKKDLSLADTPKSESVTFEFDGAIRPEDLSISAESESPVYLSVTIETRPELMPI